MFWKMKEESKGSEYTVEVKDLSSGFCIYRMNADEFSEVRKMVIIQ